jgi:deoxyribose-phosphate aldolase
MNATVFRITENGYITDKMTVKACKISKQIMVQLLQTGTDEKPSSKTVSQVLLIFYNSIFHSKLICLSIFSYQF